jgi:F0F1-type ATP synthase membrane subunit b/b'
LEGFNWITGALVPYFNFFLFCGMLYFFAGKTVRAAIKQKRDDFLKIAQDAQAAKIEAQKQQQSLNEKFQGLEKELDLIRQQNRKMAEEEALGIINGARELAKAIEEQAQNTIKQLEEECFVRLRDQLLAEVESEVQNKIKEADSSKVFASSLSQLKAVASEVAR